MHDVLAQGVAALAFDIRCGKGWGRGSRRARGKEGGGIVIYEHGVQQEVGLRGARRGDGQSVAR